eukprot:TRINITY_DN2738_c0_g1_i3.p1 TRINITY_DN2738_c0_g1~~TRINITY_DN2738_c0_g1_i3.p1  ORF type:complete len:308 (+),score=33.86 TRINITY_DN2738_c0_g1_i3:595-1518(+)
MESRDREGAKRKRGDSSNSSCSDPFFGCYLLTSLKEKCQDHCYIGFTVNPPRRLKQHNGLLPHGAWKTSKKRPWEMVMVIYGFPSKISALQFEWEWQHPSDSKRMREAFRLIQGVGNKHFLRAKIRIVYEMLRLAPWNRFPLTVQWLSTKYKSDPRYTSTCPQIPSHMDIIIAPLESLQIAANSVDSDEEKEDEEREVSLEEEEEETTEENEVGLLTTPKWNENCSLCFTKLPEDNKWVMCDECGTRSHVICLAKWLINQEVQQKPLPIGQLPPLLPTKGPCPSCLCPLSWATLVSKLRRRCPTVGK